jgi:hypothetical protein
MHPVATAFVLALFVRMGLSALLLGSGHWPVAPDERQYVELAGVVASGRPASAWDAAWGSDLYSQTATFLIPVTWLFRLFGAHVYLAMIVAAVAGAAVAAVTARLMLEVASRAWALVAGSVVALLPSQALWSSLVLRESAAWAALAVLGLLVALAMQATQGSRLALLGALIVVDLFALFHLRPYVFVVACWAVFGAAAIAGAARTWVAPAGALATALALPALCGIGIGGATLVSTNLPVLAAIQRHLAVGADSAIVKPAPTAPATPAAAPSRKHVGEPESAGSAGFKHILQGVLAVTLRPFPWERPTGMGVRFAQAENLIWAALYALAGYGLWARRRERRVIAFPAVFVVGFLMMSALFEGNVGTAFRHRGQVAWALVFLAICGLEAIGRRPRPAAGRSAVDANPSTAELVVE